VSEQRWHPYFNRSRAITMTIQRPEKGRQQERKERETSRKRTIGQVVEPAANTSHSARFSRRDRHRVEAGIMCHIENRGCE